MTRYRLCAFADEADKSIDGQIEVLNHHGIRLLEIRGVDGENISEITEKKAHEVKAKLDTHGISVWSVGSPIGKIKITDDFHDHLEKFKRTLNTAHILGADHMRIFSFFVPTGEAQMYSDEVCRRLSLLCDSARGSGIMLCHENEKGIFGDNAARCEYIHKNLPGLRAVFDPANFIQCGQDVSAAWEMLSAYVEYMHIKDATADGKVVPAGAGIGNIDTLLSNYNSDVLTLEPHLTVFDGLSALEGEEKTKIDAYRYPSAREAFAAAVSALKDIAAKHT